MDIIASTDILNRLHITGLLICTRDIEQPAVITVLSSDSMICVMPATFAAESAVSLRIKVMDDYYNVPAECISNLEGGFFSIQFDGSLLPDVLRQSIAEIVTLRGNVQQRREERIPVDGRINIYKKAKVISKRNYDCAICDISFSGAKFIILNSNAPVEGDNVVLKIDFFSPSDSFFLFSTILRRRDFSILEHSLCELAVKFNDPVSIFFQERIQSFFNVK